ncbi:MAG: PEP-utilizing enzyme [Candidatus Micrarchaeota archaeon]
MESATPRYLNDDAEEWMLGEDLPEIDLFFGQSWLHGFVNNMEEACGRAYRKCLAVFRGLGCKFYFGKRDAEEFAAYLVAKLEKEKDFGEKINTNIRVHSERMVAHAKTVPEEGLEKVSNEQLISILEEHLRLHRELYGWGMITNAMDIYFPVLSTNLRRILKKHTADEREINEYFIALTAPEEISEAAKEEMEFLKVAAKIKGSGDILLEKPDTLELVKAHWGKYRHIKFLYNGTPSEIDDYCHHIKEYFSNGKNPEEEIRRMNNDLVENRKRKLALEGKLALSGEEKRLFDAYASFMLSKYVRRYAQIYSLFKMDFVLKEIAKRLGLNIIEVRNTLVPELGKMLLSGKVDRKKVAERARLNAVYVEKGIMMQFVGEDAEVLEGIAERKNKADLKITEFRGQVASLGYAKGRAKLIFTPEDMLKFGQGDILVAISTNPDVVPAMRKAAAIVTEQGGVTSHAAIVSRELGVPCVIGTKIATKVIKDGDIVEVDARNGIVRILPK